jgi:hypothetical protein
MNPSCALKNGGRNRRKCECGVVKGAGQPGVQWKWVGTTWFRRLVQKDSYFELGQVRYVLQSPQKMQLCGHGKKAEKADWDGVCSGVWCVCNKTSYIPWTIRVKASFLHDNQVPHPKYQCFCTVISARLRKARANEVPLCFRCAASLRAHPNRYHQRSAPSRIHCQLYVKGVVLLSSIDCVTMTKISQKILRHTLVWKIHGLVFTTRVEDELRCRCRCT